MTPRRVRCNLKGPDHELEAHTLRRTTKEARANTVSSKDGRNHAAAVAAAPRAMEDFYQVAALGPRFPC